MSNTVYHPRPGALHTDLGDELFVVDGNTGRSYRLNASARKAWLQLPTTAEQLAQAFSADYGLPAEDALRDARSALGDFQACAIAETGAVEMRTPPKGYPPTTPAP